MSGSTVGPRKEQPDAAQVRRWRFDRLREAGYGPETASVLSRRTDVDLHLAIELVARGCPPETALRILA